MKTRLLLLNDCKHLKIIYVNCDLRNEFGSNLHNNEQACMEVEPWPLWYRCSALPTGSWSLCWFVINPWSYRYYWHRLRIRPRKHWEFYDYHTKLLSHPWVFYSYSLSAALIIEELKENQATKWLAIYIRTTGWERW